MTACAGMVALDQRTMERWLGNDAGVEDHEGPEPVALVPVEIVEAPTTTTAAMTLVSPSGYRLERLSLDEAVRALERLR